MVLDPIPQSLPVHFFGSRPQPPTSSKNGGSIAHVCVNLNWNPSANGNHIRNLPDFQFDSVEYKYMNVNVGTENWKNRKLKNESWKTRKLKNVFKLCVYACACACMHLIWMCICTFIWYVCVCVCVCVCECLCVKVYAWQEYASAIQRLGEWEGYVRLCLSVYLCASIRVMQLTKP